MRLNHTHLVQGNQRSLVPKSAIWEADFQTQPNLAEQADPGEEGGVAQSKRFWHSLLHSPSILQSLNQHLGPGCTLDAQTIKAQINAGDSGCFPRQNRQQDEERQGNKLHWLSSL
jgi:hypothetical protein